MNLLFLSFSRHYFNWTLNVSVILIEFRERHSCVSWTFTHCALEAKAMGCQCCSKIDAQRSSAVNYKALHLRARQGHFIETKLCINCPFLAFHTLILIYIEHLSQHQMLMNWFNFFLFSFQVTLCRNIYGILKLPHYHNRL